MALTDQVNEKLKQAMKDKNEAALRALRAIKSAILLAKTEKGGAGELDADTEIRLLQKLVKQRKESIEIYQKQNRQDLLKGEQDELDVIEGFLPKQASEDEVRLVVEKIIKETGVSSASEIGKVMPLAMKELAGRADGKIISAVAREVLSK